MGLFFKVATLFKLSYNKEQYIWNVSQVGLFLNLPFLSAPISRPGINKTVINHKLGNQKSTNKGDDMLDKEQRRAKVLEVLNKARSMELRAISQYMYHHYLLDGLDYGELASKMRKIAIDEMRHAEDLAERVTDLNGDPTTELAEKPVKGHDVKAVYPFDANLEDGTIEVYNQFVQICRENGDQVSANLLERIIDEEQEHYNYFDDTRNHINELGVSFLARVAGGDSD